MNRPQGTHGGFRWWLLFFLVLFVLLWLGVQPVLAGMVWPANARGRWNHGQMDSPDSEGK